MGYNYFQQGIGLQIHLYCCVRDRNRNTCTGVQGERLGMKGLTLFGARLKGIKKL